jgi:hypothetical protein
MSQLLGKLRGLWPGPQTAHKPDIATTFRWPVSTAYRSPAYQVRLASMSRSAGRTPARSLKARRLGGWGAIVAAQLALCGCGGAPQRQGIAAPTPSSMASHSLSDYLPLENDTVMSFETETEGSVERGLLIVQVRRPRANVVELNVGGKIRRMDLTKEGVRLFDGGWLLKEPLEVGATFPGQNGKVRVSSTTREINVPAGHFRDCVELEETGRAAKTTTVFCPLVGITFIEVESLSLDTPERVTARLKASGPRIDLGGDQVRIQPE